MKGKYFEMLPGFNRESVKLGFSHVLFIPFLNLDATQSSTEDLEDGMGEKPTVKFCGKCLGCGGTLQNPSPAPACEKCSSSMCSCAGLGQAEGSL